MQREIKFRGKRIDSGEWIYGSLVGIDDIAVIVDHRDFCWNPCTDVYSFWFDMKNNEVDTNTVGQYTGLKDQNGRDIYEGDVVCLGDVKRRTGVIVRSDTAPAFVLEVNGTAFDLYYRSQPRYEVVGNIYDNQEFGLKVLSTGRGEVKPVDCPKKLWQENRGGADISEAHALRRE